MIRFLGRGLVDVPKAESDGEIARARTEENRRLRKVNAVRNSKRPTATYGLDVEIDGRWVRQCEIAAASHADAFRWASMCLKSEHYDKPIRVLPTEPISREPTAPVLRQPTRRP